MLFTNILIFSYFCCTYKINVAPSVCIYTQRELLVKYPCFDLLSLILSLPMPHPNRLFTPLLFCFIFQFLSKSFFASFILPSPLIIMSRHVFWRSPYAFSFFVFLCCISINFLLSSQAIRGEGAGRVWGVAEEAFRVHQQPDENRLHHHSIAEGNHAHSPSLMLLLLVIVYLPVGLCLIVFLLLMLQLL